MKLQPIKSQNNSCSTKSSTKYLTVAFPA